MGVLKEKKIKNIFKNRAFDAHRLEVLKKRSGEKWKKGGNKVEKLTNH